MTRNFSIVVPTYNRRDILLKTLEAYKNQTAVDGILELIVIDDGSTDGTERAVPQSALVSPFPIRYLRQDHKGPARGRNYAIRESKGDLVLMGDDDIIPVSSYVAEHLNWHKKYPAESDAVLGRVAWSPEVNPTPFMEWLGQGGVITGYGDMHAGLQNRPTFYSGVISLKRQFLLRNGVFDEEFSTYGFEDIELGCRLAKEGLRVFYNPDAVGYHCKKVTLADIWRRAEVVFTAEPLFLAKLGRAENPNQFQGGSIFKKTARKLVRAVLPAAAPALRLFDTQIPLPQVVYWLFYYHYIVPTTKARVQQSGLKMAPSLRKVEQEAE